jgi:hypothetical protein
MNSLNSAGYFIIRGSGAIGWVGEEFFEEVEEDGVALK